MPMQILITILQFLRDHWKDFRPFVRSVLKQPVALTLCGTLLSGSVLLGAWYWVRSSKYESIINQTLQADLENTPQRFKGLEAFIFSNVPADLDAELSKERFNPKFVSQYQQMADKISEVVAQDRLALDKLQTLELKASNSGGEILTEVDENTPGFLFLPFFLLRGSNDLQRIDTGTNVIVGRQSTKPDGQNPGKPKANNQHALRMNDVSVQQELTLLESISNEIQELTSKSVFESNSGSRVTEYLESEPTQVYLITKSGLNKVFTHLKNPSDLYGNQFPATTFFPSRPYFWPTFADQKITTVGAKGELRDGAPTPGVVVGNFFHLSRPYMDLGGSGVVITLTRAIKIKGVTEAVLCFDMRFKPEQSLYAALEKAISGFGGTLLETTCKISGVVPPHCEVPGVRGVGDLNEEQKILYGDITNALTTSKEDFERSRILGNIQELGKATAGSSLIRFSVPMDQEFSADGTQTAKLLLASLNLSGYRTTTSEIALGAASLFGITTVLLAYLWGSTVMQRREYELAFHQVGEVMYNSPTPYVRLSSDDYIVDASASFCTVLGYEVTEQAFEHLRTKKFRSFCADKRSMDEYDTIERLRKERASVEPYLLTLTRVGKTPITVRVCSAAVPSSALGELPETFGILIDPEKPVRHQADVADQPQQKTEPQAPARNIM